LQIQTACKTYIIVHMSYTEHTPNSHTYKQDITHVKHIHVPTFITTHRGASQLAWPYQEPVKAEKFLMCHVTDTIRTLIVLDVPAGKDKLCALKKSRRQIANKSKLE